MSDFKKPEIPSVSPEEVKKAIDTKDKFVLLDVRTQMEYARGKLEGAVNLPLDEIHGKITEAVPDKTDKVYVYCLSGSRSIVAVGEMMMLGYKNVFDMQNGLLAWRVKGFPVSV